MPGCTATQTLFAEFNLSLRRIRGRVLRILTLEGVLNDTLEGLSQHVLESFPRAFLCVEVFSQPQLFLKYSVRGHSSNTSGQKGGGLDKREGSVNQCGRSRTGGSSKNVRNVKYFAFRTFTRNTIRTLGRGCL